MQSVLLDSFAVLPKFIDAWICSTVKTSIKNWTVLPRINFCPLRILLINGAVNAAMP